jgi:hypothetical protein
VFYFCIISNELDLFEVSCLILEFVGEILKLVSSEWYAFHGPKDVSIAAEEYISYFLQLSILLQLRYELLRYDNLRISHLQGTDEHSV